MRQTLVMLTMVGTALCLDAAVKPIDFDIQCQTMDYVVSGRNISAASKAQNITFLQAVALGKPLNYRGVSPELQPLSEADLTPAYVRMCAMRSLGRAGDQNAHRFLLNLKKSDLAVGPENIRLVWIGAQIALHESQLASMLTLSERRAFLEGIIQKKHEPVIASALVSWAVNQLCDDGETSSLPVIADSIRKRLTVDSAPALTFCEVRMQIVNRDPDRLSALSMALADKERAQDPRVTGWIIYQINAMRSPEADLVLDRYEEALSSESTEKLAQSGNWGLVLTIRNLRSKRNLR